MGALGRSVLNETRCFAKLFDTLSPPLALPTQSLNGRTATKRQISFSYLPGSRRNNATDYNNSHISTAARLGGEGSGGGVGNVITYEVCAGLCPHDLPLPLAPRWHLLARLFFFFVRLTGQLDKNRLVLL
jgi:hypothetical protein